MYCPHCGQEIASTANFCSACGAAASHSHVTYPQPFLVRPRYSRVIAGVCSGVALRYNWNLLLVRILLVVFTLLTSGLGILVYIAGWVLIPDAPYALPANSYPQTPSGV